MKKYLFEVTVVEEYYDKIEIEAENEEQAREKLQLDLDEDAITERRNTYNGGSENIELVGIKDA